MNAKMRIGLTASAGFLAALMGLFPAHAGSKSFDNQLQAWAAQRAAEKVDAPLRGTYDADQSLRLVTVADLVAEAAPLDAQTILLRRQILKPFAIE